MRPSFPEAATLFAGTLFSAIILAAAIEGVPLAYEVFSFTGFGDGATVFASTAFGASTTGVSSLIAGATEPSGLGAEVSIKHTT